MSHSSTSTAADPRARFEELSALERGAADVVHLLRELLEVRHVD